jgi:mycothiol system anti-sigma-R factor
LFGSDCRRILREIELYLDGEIAGDRCGQIERHLTGCGSCLRHLDFQRELKLLIRRKCRAEGVPPELIERIRSALESG